MTMTILSFKYANSFVLLCALPNSHDLVNSHVLAYRILSPSLVKSRYFSVGKKDTTITQASDTSYIEDCSYSSSFSFSHLLDKATSRYLWLTPQFYYDLMQTLLSRVYNSLEWGLGSPPKPHAFVSLPVQSGFFSNRFYLIKDKLNVSFFYTVFLVLFIYIAYRLPTLFMLSELKLLLYFPLFNAAYTLICAISIAHVRKKKLTMPRLVFMAFFSLSVAFIKFSCSEYYHDLYLHLDISRICEFLVDLLWPVVILDITGYATTPGPVTMHKGPASTPGLGASGSASGSGPDSGSGSQAAGSGSQAAGSGSQAAGSGSIPGFGSLLASTVDATPPALSTPPSNVPAESIPTLPNVAGILGASGSVAGDTSALPIQAKGQFIYPDNLTDTQLDGLYGPYPSKMQLDRICEKIVAQRTQPKSKSIYGDYPANTTTNGRDATLTYEEQNIIARKLLGLRKGYFSQLSGSDSNPRLKVMKQTNLGPKAVNNNKSVVRDLQ